MGLYEDFIYVRSYSRWIPELKRRETYPETVDRFCNFIFNETRNCNKIPEKTKKRIKELILNLEIAPSMRLMWSAGENVKRDNIAAYNCAAMAMHSLECFGEMMYILLAGAGCGYSVEDRYVSKLPVIKKQKNREPLHFVIPDTKLGWKQAVDFGVSAWVDGRDAVFGYERIRPAGTPLVISGGYASGSAALQRCIEFLRETFINAQERQLEPLEVSDINNEIGNSVICGGVRRSSQACLSDVDDLTMRDSKQGNFNPRRFMANISGVYRKKPNVLDFAQEFINMGRSGSGERGIYNLTAVRKRSPKRRDKNQIILTNPCFETTLRDMQCCNLSEAVVRAADDFDDMVNKIKAVSWLGAIQSTLSYFPILRPEWTKNAEEERLMGVSITGLCDNMDLITPETLRHWRRIATKTAEEASKTLDINMPAAITLLKPSGTVSQRVDCSSGLHSRWAKFYIRRVRISTHDSLFKTIVDQEMPYELDKGNHDTAIFSFPIKSPEGAKLREQDTAIGQLEWYKMIVSNFCDQNASCFSGDTKFFTKEGLLPFNSFEHGDAVEVLNGEGKWTQGTVKKFGEQEIYEIHISSAKRSMIIRTTKDHLWPITYNYQRWAGWKMKTFKTEELPIGKQFVQVFPENNPGYVLDGFLHGMIMGDGSLYNKHRNNPMSQIILFGGKRDMTPLFIARGFKLSSFKPKKHPDSDVFYTLPREWKELPSTKDPAYIRSFIAGWFATDGSVDKKGGTFGISSVNKSNMKWLLDNSGIGGIGTTSCVGETISSTSYNNNCKYYKVALIKETLDPDFFLLTQHRERYEIGIRQEQQSAKHWRIVKVIPTGVVEPVYCVEEPVGQHFVIDGNILTHNCTIYIKDEEWIETMDYIYRNWDTISGVSFFPYSNKKYDQPPYEEIDELAYKRMVNAMPSIDLTRLCEFEDTDNTEGATTLACSSATGCEI